MPAVALIDPLGLPSVVSREQARAAGVTDKRIREHVEAGRWEPLRRGVYLRREAALMSPRPAEHRDLEHVYSAVAAAISRRGSVVSHGSAALALRLPLASGTPQLPHLTVSPTAPTGTRSGIVAHRRSLHRRDVGLVDITAVWTDPERGDALAFAAVLRQHWHRSRPQRARSWTWPERRASLTPSPSATVRSGADW